MLGRATKPMWEIQLGNSTRKVSQQEKKQIYGGGDVLKQQR